jgi:pimeloyl-ACP methyl ester carboxylesterase
MAKMTKEISEQAVQFGQQKSLVGILAQAAKAAPSDRPAVVILNTGIIHRVGHHRMHVAMSRRLAEAGNTVLRFDFSGIGDSASRADGLAPLESCLADIGDAIDWLESARQASRIILVGLCSGADYAVLYGYRDPRVVGLILLDPSIPPTARYYVHYIARRLIRLSSWLNVPLGRSRIWRMLTERAVGALRSDWKSQRMRLQHPTARSDLEQIYRNSVRRGIQFLAVFTGGRNASRQTYREQLLDAFPGVSFAGLLRLEYFKECDHTFMSQFHRELLTRLVIEWTGNTKFTVAAR